MTTISRATRGGLLSLLWFACALQPAAATASAGQCGQPVSQTEGPGAADSLAILQEAVGGATACDAKPCICDVNGSGKVSAIDALITLKKAVGQDVALVCSCPPIDYLGCSSVEATILPGSMLDLGWTGLSHDLPLAAGFKLQFDVVSRCSNDQSICEKNADCPANGTCKRTCDCVDDTTCELAGPVGPKRCRTTLAECTSNADCAAGVPCMDTFSPPQPLSSGGTPTCIVPFFQESIHGTADVASGEVLLEGATLLWRIVLGITLDQPCPRCGQTGQQPAIGDAFTCEGGQSPGEACTVDAVHPYFGGTSYDCPPNLSSAIMGNGQTVRLQALTTGNTTRTAQLPCSDFSFQSHPSRGNGKCGDNNAACTSNADCTRCSEDPTTACASNADCTDKGACAEAPDQPVTCGFWCHCGFCNNDPNLPCFQDGDCGDGKICMVGTGGSTAQNAPQKKPNDCSGDKFICGLSEDETCDSTPTGACSEQPWRNCQDDLVCETNGAGTCVLEPRSCFEPRVTRHGEPSALAGHCEADGGPCSNNADCATIGDACLSRTMAPALEALGCMPASSSNAVNSVHGTTGPASLRLEQLLRWCSCGDSELGCSEQCDDGNQIPGDGCDERCREE